MIIYLNNLIFLPEALWKYQLPLQWQQPSIKNIIDDYIFSARALHPSE